MRRLFALLALSLCVTALLSGQNTTAGITGTVRSEGEPLEGVNVQFVSQAQNSVIGAASNKAGLYSVSGLRPGMYDVSFSYIGYKTLTVSDVRVSFGEDYVLDVELTADEYMTPDIDVSAYYSHFNEVKTGQTYSVKNERIELLPSISRSILDYTRLSPYSGLDNSMAGRDGRMTTLTIDGAGLSNIFGLSSDLPGGGNPVSVDAIDEVQVVIAPYDVRQSGFVGGGINAVTKSGTNIFKASAYTFQRNGSLRGNSIDGHDLGERQKESRSVYGLTVGGPILRDRLFFFVSGELERSPEPITRWRLSSDGIGDGAAMVSRVTQSDMDRFQNMLSMYGYDAGTTDLTDGGLTNTKVLARLDWNISDNNNLMLRFNYTKNSQWLTPNATSTVGIKAPSERISKNAYAFKGNCYTLDDVAWSAVAELNSRFGKVNNRLLLTTSMVGNSRGSDSDLFPHIDIWKDGDAFMSAGYELFSLNTGNNAYTYNLSDHARMTVGRNTLTFGISYDLHTASTNYMQFGSGYYKYQSIEDFENGNAPIAFGYTYGYDGIDNPASKSSLGQGALFVQGETDFGERLRLTYGLRADLTNYFNKISTNLSYYNLDWTNHYFSHSESVPASWNTPRIDTGQWPETSVQLSPRVGFNWDVTGNGNLVLRGGAGLFAGNIPLVFLTNLPNYSNMLQNTVMVSSDTDGFLSGLAGRFLHTQEELLTYLASCGYPMSANSTAPVRNASICGIESDFKLPQVFKTSLCAEWNIPFSFPASIMVEGIYNKDINAVYARNINILNHKDFVRFTGSDNRLNYRSQDNSNTPASPLVNGNVTGGAMLLSNTSYGYSWSLATTLNMEPVRNLKIELSYIHQSSKSVSDMSGSSLYSTWKSVVSVNDPNEEVARSSKYVMPDRVMAAVTYTLNHGKRFNTSIGLFYDGKNTGRYSYMYINDMNGDGVVNDLVYIPSSKDDIQFVDNNIYSAEQQQDAFWSFVCNDKYLSRHKGEYASANDALCPWLNRFDVRVVETLRIGSGRDSHKVQLSIDLMNAGNLLCDKWGVQQTPSGCNDGRILTFAGTDSANRPQYSLYSDANGLLKNTFKPLQNAANCWYLQFGLKYIFN